MADRLLTRRQAIGASSLQGMASGRSNTGAFGGTCHMPRAEPVRCGREGSVRRQRLGESLGASASFSSPAWGSRVARATTGAHQLGPPSWRAQWALAPERVGQQPAPLLDGLSWHVPRTRPGAELVARATNGGHRNSRTRTWMRWVRHRKGRTISRPPPRLGRVARATKEAARPRGGRAGPLFVARATRAVRRTGDKKRCVQSLAGRHDSGLASQAVGVCGTCHQAAIDEVSWARVEARRLAGKPPSVVARATGEGLDVRVAG